MTTTMMMLLWMICFLNSNVPQQVKEALGPARRKEAEHANVDEATIVPTLRASAGLVFFRSILAFPSHLMSSHQQDLDELVRLCEWKLAGGLDKDEEKPARADFFEYLPVLDNTISKLVVNEFEEYALVCVVSFCDNQYLPTPPSTSGHCPLYDIANAMLAHYPSADQLEHFKEGGLLVRFDTDAGTLEGEMVSPIVSASQKAGESMVKTGILPDACGADGGLLLGGKGLLVDTLPVYGKANSGGKHVAKEYKPIFEYLQCMIYSLIFKMKLVPKVGLFSCLGVPAKKARVETLYPMIEMECPEYKGLIQHANLLDHPSMFFKGIIDTGLSRNFMIGIAKMLLANARLSHRLDQTVQKLDQLDQGTIHNMLCAVFEEVVDGMRYRGGRNAVAREAGVHNPDNADKVAEGRSLGGIRTFERGAEGSRKGVATNAANGTGIHGLTSSQKQAAGQKGAYRKELKKL